MKNLLLFLFVAILGFICHAQNCDSIAKVDIIDKIKGYSPDDLLVYYDKTSDNWGYMTKEGRILTIPLFNAPNMLVFYPDANVFTPTCMITINGKDLSFDAEIMEAREATEDSSYNELRKSNYKGFDIDKNTLEFTAVSDEYFEVYFPFLYRGKYYAIAALKDTYKYGIIDQKGKTLRGFGFKYNDLNGSYNSQYKDTSQTWFYFEDEKGKMGFKNLKKKIKLYGQLLSSPLLDEPYAVQNDDTLS